VERGGGERVERGGGLRVERGRGGGAWRGEVGGGAWSGGVGAVARVWALGERRRKSGQTAGFVRLAVAGATGGLRGRGYVTIGLLASNHFANR